MVVHFTKAQKFEMKHANKDLPTRNQQFFFAKLIIPEQNIAFNEGFVFS
jgi:hypothetical protein